MHFTRCRASLKTMPRLPKSTQNLVLYTVGWIMSHLPQLRKGQSADHSLKRCLETREQLILEHVAWKKQSLWYIRLCKEPKGEYHLERAICQIRKTQRPPKGKEFWRLALRRWPKHLAHKIAQSVFHCQQERSFKFTASDNESQFHLHYTMGVSICAAQFLGKSGTTEKHLEVLAFRLLWSNLIQNVFQLGKK